MITRAQSLGLGGLLVYLDQGRNGHLAFKRYGMAGIFVSLIGMVIAARLRREHAKRGPQGPLE